jgi:hypothetical protein
MNTPRKYKKISKEIEAIQFTGDNFQQVILFLGAFPHKYIHSEKMLLIHTLEGDLIVRIGDYVIRGIYDEYYPIKPDIFRESYIELSNQQSNI